MDIEAVEPFFLAWGSGKERVNRCPRGLRAGGSEAPWRDSAIERVVTTEGGEILHDSQAKIKDPAAGPSIPVAQGKIANVQIGTA